MGGWAVRLYGLPRPAYDIDFTIAIPREKLPELCDAVHSAGLNVPEQFANGWVDAVAGMPRVKFPLFVAQRTIDIDVFIAESEYRQAIMDRRRTHAVAGKPAWFMSPEDLILLKLIASHKRDLADMEDILLAQPDLDESYVRQWANRFGVEDRLEAAVADRP